MVNFSRALDVFYKTSVILSIPAALFYYGLGAYVLLVPTKPKEYPPGAIGSREWILEKAAEERARKQRIKEKEERNARRKEEQSGW